jgi:hypothetical protein
MRVGNYAGKTGHDDRATVTPNAGAYHIVASLAVLAWRTALAAKGVTYRFFEHLRTITTYVVFQNWAHLLRSIAEANIRPP